MMGDERDTSHEKPEEDQGQEVLSEESGEAGAPAEEENISAGETKEWTDEEGTNDLENLQQELEAMTLKARENLELAQRAQAEMENLRKRTMRDIENAHKYALEKFVLDLLPVIDSLELGLNASEAAGDITSLREGMDLTLKKFTGSLEKFGVAVVDPAGEKFNPEKHDAVSMTDAEAAEPGTVISVLQKGYELNGRLVRPAMVVVAK